MRKALAIIVATSLPILATPARAEPANSLKELFAGLNRCFSAISLVEGDDVTVQFMLNRSGGVIGKPRLTHAHFVGDAAARKSSAEAIAKGFDHCLPVAITDALGGAIAGRLIAYRLSGDRGEL